MQRRPAEEGRARERGRESCGQEGASDKAIRTGEREYAVEAGLAGSENGRGGAAQGGSGLCAHRLGL